MEALTTLEKQAIQQYCLGRITRDPAQQQARNEMLDDLAYYYQQSMQPDFEAGKRETLTKLDQLIIQWRQSTMTTSTTTVPTKPTETKGPGLLAIEALQSQVNDLISEVRTLRSEIGIVHGLLESFRTQLQSAPARAISTDVSQIPNSVTFRATQLILTFDDKGSPAYKVKGGRFSTWGVRVWPEVLPVLGIDPARLKPGPNVIDLNVVAEIAEKIDEETGESKTVAKKVIGLAMA